MHFFGQVSVNSFGSYILTVSVHINDVHISKISGLFPVIPLITEFPVLFPLSIPVKHLLPLYIYGNWNSGSAELRVTRNSVKSQLRIALHAALATRGLGIRGLVVCGHKNSEYRWKTAINSVTLPNLGLKEWFWYSRLDIFQERNHRE